MWSKSNENYILSKIPKRFLKYYSILEDVHLPNYHGKKLWKFKSPSSRSTNRRIKNWKSWAHLHTSGMIHSSNISISSIKKQVLPRKKKIAFKYCLLHTLQCSWELKFLASQQKFSTLYRQLLSPQPTSTHWNYTRPRQDASRQITPLPKHCKNVRSRKLQCDQIMGDKNVCDVIYV